MIIAGLGMPWSYRLKMTSVLGAALFGECIPRRAVTGTESPMNHDIIITAGQSALGSTVRELADNSPMTGDLTSPGIPYRRMYQSNKYIKQNQLTSRNSVDYSQFWFLVHIQAGEAWLGMRTRLMAKQNITPTSHNFLLLPPIPPEEILSLFAWDPLGKEFFAGIYNEHILIEV